MMSIGEFIGLAWPCTRDAPFVKVDVANLGAMNIASCIIRTGDQAVISKLLARLGLSKGQPHEQKYTSIDPKQQQAKWSQPSIQTKGDKAKSSQPSIQTGETKGDKAKSSQPTIHTRHDREGETKGGKAKSSHPASRHAMRDKGRRGETKQNHSPASRHAMGDKEWQREKKQHLSPGSRHAMGDKGRQRETKQNQSTRGDKKWSQPSIQTRHGRQGETKGDKAKSSQPSIQTRRGRQGRESSWPSIVSMQELRTPHSKAVWWKRLCFRSLEAKLLLLTTTLNVFGCTQNIPVFASCSHRVHCHVFWNWLSSFRVWPVRWTSHDLPTRRADPGFAVRKGHVEAVQELIEANADVPRRQRGYEPTSRWQVFSGWVQKHPKTIVVWQNVCLLFVCVPNLRTWDTKCKVSKTISHAFEKRSICD